MNRLGTRVAEVHEWVTEFALVLAEHKIWFTSSFLWFVRPQKRMRSTKTIGHLEIYLILSRTVPCKRPPLSPSQALATGHTVTHDRAALGGDHYLRVRAALREEKRKNKKCGEMSFGQFHHLGLLNNELVTLSEELCSAFLRNEDRRPQVAESYDMWIQRREEARRAHDASRLAEDAARDAECESKRYIERLVASEAASEMRSKEVAANQRSGMVTSNARHGGSARSLQHSAMPLMRGAASNLSMFSPTLFCIPLWCFRRVCSQTQSGLCRIQNVRQSTVH